jgi:hypothetical protein
MLESTKQPLYAEARNHPIIQACYVLRMQGLPGWQALQRWPYIYTQSRVLMKKNMAKRVAIKQKVTGTSLA